MGLTSFVIILDNLHESYFSGQIVSGRVVINLDRPKKVKGVKLKLQGKAKTHWKESRGKSSTTVSETEHYIDEKVYLFGYEESSPESILPQGRNEYPFYFKLPNGIPSSFEMKHGYVKYYIEAVISRSLKFDHRCRRLFTVNGILDLNSEWDSKHNLELCKEKYLCCLCCTSGPIGFKIQLPRKGYVPGESISFVIDVNNISQRKIDTVTLSLVQQATFHAKKKTKEETMTVNSMNGPCIEPGETETWQGINILQIPSVPPSRLGGGCSIIAVEYLIKLEVQIPGSISLTGSIPIIVGTIPLQNTFEDFMPPGSTSSPVVQTNQPSNSLQVPDTESLLSAAVSYSASLMPITMVDYPNLPPPTYEEAVFYHNCENDGEDVNSDSGEPQQPPDYGNATTTSNTGGGSEMFGISPRFIPKYVTYQSLLTPSASPQIRSGHKN